MPLIIGFILLIAAFYLIKLYWVLILMVIVGSTISFFIIYFISEKMKENKSESTIKTYDAISGFFMFISFLGICYFSGLYWYNHYDKHVIDAKIDEEKRLEQEKIIDKKNIEKTETVQTEKNEPVKKSFNVNEWCKRYFAIIDDIENKWKIFRENDSEFVVPMQNLARSMESAHNKIDNSPEYKIPENVPENVKDKMQNIITNLYDGMEDLAYSLRVMAEYAEEVSGSNDLPNRILIPYGASEEEIYYYAEKAKERYNNAKIKFETAKNLLNEINN